MSFAVRSLKRAEPSAAMSPTQMSVIAESRTPTPHSSASSQPERPTLPPASTLTQHADAQESQQVAQRSRWQAVFLEAGGISAALSEESMRRLKYCLQWLQVRKASPTRCVRYACSCCFIHTVRHGADRRPDPCPPQLHLLAPTQRHLAKRDPHFTAALTHLADGEARCRRYDPPGRGGRQPLRRRGAPRTCTLACPFIYPPSTAEMGRCVGRWRGRSFPRNRHRTRYPRGEHRDCIWYGQRKASWDSTLQLWPGRSWPLSSIAPCFACNVSSAWTEQDARTFQANEQCHDWANPSDRRWCYSGRSEDLDVGDRELGHAARCDGCLQRQFGTGRHVSVPLSSS